MKEIIAIVGAGGKTTLLHRLSKQFQEEGKKVFATTTTHMAYEEDMVITGKVEEIKEQMDTKGLCLAGTFDPGKGKISALPPDVYEQACTYADVVLIEADGANHHTVKFPADYEPVIPANVTTMLVIMGTMDLGKPLGEVVHRWKLLQEKYEELKAEDSLTMGWIRKIAYEGYVNPWKEKRPGLDIHVLFTKCVDRQLIYIKESEMKV